MKRSTILIAIIFLLLGGEVSAKKPVWKKIGKFAGKLASAAAGVAIEQAAEYSGYKPEEAKQMTHDLIGNFGLNTENVDKGLEYISASDKYAKQNLVANFVLDEAIENEEGGKGNGAVLALLSSIKEMSNAQLTYLSESRKAMPQEEKQMPFDTLLTRYAYVAHDAYKLAKQPKAKKLSEELQIKSQLISNGVDSELADDVAGTILAVQKSSDMSEQEKFDYLKAFGLSQTPEQIEEVAETVLNTDEQFEEVGRVEAMKQLKSIVIDGCLFNRVFFTRDQKLKLDAVADILNQYAGLKVCLVGHTCEIGGKEINHRVGLQRAEVGKEYLVKKGIDPERILIDSKGDTQPVVPNSSDMNRSQNRRLEIIVID